MRETGEIIRIEEDGRGVVRLDVRGGCDHCGMNGSCHPSGTGVRELRLPLKGDVFHAGDVVEIETSSRSLIAAAFLVFILPLILSIAAYGIVSRWLNRPGWAVGGFFLMFVVSEFLISWIDRHWGKKSFFEPRVVGKFPVGGRLSP
jgi:positive regulator of sigma E activity